MNQVHQIAAKHQAYGVEGLTVYRGSILGAKRAANKIAKAGGHGWSPIVKTYNVVKVAANGSVLIHSDDAGPAILRGNKIEAAELTA